MTIAPQNDAPVAPDYELHGFGDLQAIGNLLAGNGDGPVTDPDGDPLSVTAGVFATEKGGSVMIAATGDFTYAGAPNFFGLDGFTYELDD